MPTKHGDPFAQAAASHTHHPLPPLTASGVTRDNLSNEVRFLLEVVTATLDQRQPVLEVEPDWPNFLESVDYHFVAPLLGSAKAAEGPIPAWVSKKLTSARFEATVRAMKLTAELANLAEVCADAGLEVLALKGPALAIQLYGTPYRRIARDIDILVPPKDERAVRALLSDHGYRAETKHAHESGNVVTLRNPNRLFPVEMHVHISDDDRLYPTLALRPFETAIEINVAHTRIRTLRLEAAIAYAAYHGGKHQWSRLFWLADFAMAMDCPAVNWSEVLEIARRTGTDRHLALAIRLTNTLLGRTPPNLPTVSNRDLAIIRKVEASIPIILALPTETLFHNSETQRPVYTRRMNQHKLRNEMLLLRGLRKRLVLLLVWLRPSITDRTLIPLPPCLAFLHYAVRPARLLSTAITVALRKAFRLLVGR